MELNELNQKAMGGTELMALRIESAIDPDDLKRLQIIHSRARNLDPNKKKIYVLHDLAGDPEVRHLKDEGWKKFDKLVFVSNWQQQMYNAYLGVPYSAGVVLKNSIDPIPKHDKPKDKVRLIYYSTPHRGLGILYSVFDALYKEFGDRIELKVFSSFELYGWPERDKPFQDLFKKLEDHPGIVYSKSVPNHVIREEIMKSHIFAYPSIWQETSCLCLIEALSGGLVSVHSSLAALPETSLGLSFMYDYTEDLNTHAQVFYANLKHAIRMVESESVGGTELTKIAADYVYSLDRRKAQWNSLAKNVLTTP